MRPQGKGWVLAAIVAAALVFAGPTGAAKAPRYSATGYFPLDGWSNPKKNPVDSWAGVVVEEPSGLPKAIYDGNHAYWNAVTISYWGLAEFDLFLREHKRFHLALAKRAGDWLVRHQTPRGAYLYRMSWSYGDMRHYTWPVPWVAAQAQANAISLFVRLWRKTGDARYYLAADKALGPYTRAVGDAGVRRRWRGHVFLEGFPTKKPSLTLEDFQLSLLALGEFSRWSPRAKLLFDEGIRTLAFAAPLYDVGGAPAYDLNHETLKQVPYYVPAAHELNQWLMRMLARRSHNAVLARYGKRWLASLRTGPAVPTRKPPVVAALEAAGFMPGGDEGTAF